MNTDTNELQHCDICTTVLDSKGKCPVCTQMYYSGSKSNASASTAPEYKRMVMESLANQLRQRVSTSKAHTGSLGDRVDAAIASLSVVDTASLQALLASLYSENQKLRIDLEEASKVADAAHRFVYDMINNDEAQATITMEDLSAAVLAMYGSKV